MAWIIVIFCHSGLLLLGAVNLEVISGPASGQYDKYVSVK